MAASPQIIINVAGESAGTPGVARTFTYAKINGVSPVVTLSIASTTGVTSYYWEIISKPVGSSATLSDPTSAAPTFSATSTFAGTYLIRVTINAGASSGTNGLAFLTEFAGLRKLSHQETLEFGSAGWTTAVNAIIDSVDSGVIGSSVPISYTYTDAADRLAATGFDSGDVGKWARQLDDGSVWILDDDSPITWGAISPDSNAPSALIPCITSPRTITDADHGKTLIAAAPVVGGFQFVLPATATAGVTVTLTTLANAGLDARVTADATGTIVGSGSLSGAGVSEVKAGAEGASITLKYLGGPNKKWVVTDGLGYWDVSVLGVPTGDYFTFTPAIPGATTGGITVFDANGQIEDSGVGLDTYRYKAEQFIPVVATPYVVSTVNDKGKWLLWGGSGTLNVTLPAASVMGSGGWIGAWNFGSGSARISLNRAGSDTLTIGTSTGSAVIYTVVKGSSARLVSNGVNGWLLLDGSGQWSNGTVFRNFDGTIPLATPGNAVTVDAYGDIVDSGSAIVTAASVAAQIEASGGGGGSDMTIYSNIAGDFSAVQTGADTIGLFGLPFSITAVQIKRIVSKPTGGVASVIAARGGTLVCTWSPSGSIAGAGTIMTTSLGTLASTDEYLIEIEGPPKGFNAATDSTKAEVTNALYYVNDSDIASLTNDSVEILKPMLVDGYNALSMTFTGNSFSEAGDNVTVLGSNDQGGTKHFYDITALAFGVPKVTVSGAYQSSEPLMFQWIKIVIDGTGSDASVELTRFRK